MARLRFLLLLALFVGSLAPAPGNAAERRKCLSGEQRRALVATQQVMPLASAVRAAGTKLPGEVIAAKLCDHGRGLVYILTLLARNGKVTRLVIDARSGHIQAGL